MRRQPVAFFLGDAAFLSDSKFRLLARKLPDADDFNSAVGAYFIALAAARRNGQPSLDLASETQSRFLTELIEVGLLVVEGFPDKAFSAWAPSRPKYPSDAKAPSAPNRSEGSDDSVSSASALRTPSPLPSLPIPSNPTTTARDGLPNLNDTVAGIWETATGRSVLASGEKVAEYLDDACRRHSPSEVGAAILRARKGFDHIPDGMALISGMRPILDPFVDPKTAKKRDQDEAEKARRRRALEETKRGMHYAHTSPDPACPACKEAA